MTVTPSFLPMEARSVPTLPIGDNWRYEPKWDGFRCLAFKAGGEIALRSKSGKPLERYFPDIVETLANLKAETFLLDGELLVETESGYSFAELQMRLHPAASRIHKLVAAHPASYMLFDLLRDAEGGDLMQQAFSARREKLEQFHRRFAHTQEHLPLSPQTASLDAAKRWMEKMNGRIDGLIAKDIGDPYAPSERRMRKYKFIRTADCVVGGFRYGTDSPLVGSLLLGLYDDQGLLNHVGFTSAFASEDKAALTGKLENLIGPPSFTGKSPGGPSRWSTERSGDWQPLSPKLVVEVSFDHVSDDRFRHGTRILRWRPDKAPGQCRMEQLHQPEYLPLPE